jgi:hypothetical protein
MYPLIKDYKYFHDKKDNIFYFIDSDNDLNKIVNN